MYTWPRALVRFFALIPSLSELSTLPLAPFLIPTPVLSLCLSLSLDRALSLPSSPLFLFLCPSSGGAVRQHNMGHLYKSHEQHHIYGLARTTPFCLESKPNERGLPPAIYTVQGHNESRLPTSPHQPLSPTHSLTHIHT